MIVATLLASIQMAAGQGQMAAPDSARLEMVVDSSSKQIVLTVGPFHLMDRSSEDTDAHSGAGHDTPVYHFDWPSSCRTTPDSSAYSSPKCLLS